MLVAGMNVYSIAMAAPITWVAQGSNNDMEVAANWDPSTVPTVGDDAIFDSTLVAVNTNPIEQILDFFCSTFQFPQNASDFEITIKNHQLVFDGVGITGDQTDAIINSTNTDTTYTVNNQIFFNGSSSTSGSANLFLDNAANITGASSNVFHSVIDRQVYSPNAFVMGDNGTINARNEGSDASTGGGGDIAAGVFQGQVIFGNTCTVGDQGTIFTSNSGTNTSSSSGSNLVGYVLEWQLYSADAFQAGDSLILTANNTGTDSSTGVGGHLVAKIASAASAGSQIEMNQACTVGDYANIIVNNSGSYDGTNTGGGCSVAITSREQARFRGAFNAGDFLFLNVSNAAFDSAQGIGLDRIGISGAAQLHFDSSCTVGNGADLNLINFAAYTGSSSSLTSSIGIINEDQINVEGIFQAGNDLNLDVFNFGIDDGQSTGNAYIGAIPNESQAQFNDTFTVGNDAVIDITNIGVCLNSGPSNNFVGYVNDHQLIVEGLLTAGKNFDLGVSNIGFANTTGSGNTVGVLGSSQVKFENSVLGEDASISVSNSGENNNATGTSNSIGVVHGFQVLFHNDFAAGKNLNLTVENFATNNGDPSNSVGVIDRSQLLFGGFCTLDDNSLISAFNSGNVLESQITFAFGFNILSGKATVHAHNEGSVGSHGIFVQGASLGGNANIILENSSLYIDTTLPTFTIGELNGNATSLVQSNPELIIDTDSLTNALFAGSIQDFPATSSTLLKQGPGIQKLSGTNTFTGLTTIDEGTLVLTGSLAGDTTVNTLGILKGTGTIGGNVINAGTIAPGESIGTLTVLGNYINNSGTYDVEVNGLGQSDLIDIAGAAALNGGLVVVSSTDGAFRFQQPYTILTADSGVSGIFTRATSAAFINPILTYDPNNVYLTIQSALTQAAESCNQIGVAQNLDGIINPNTAQSLLLSAIVGLPLEGAQAALESLSGYQHTNDIWITEIATRRFLRRLYDPLRSIVSSSCDCCDTSYDPYGEWSGWLETGEGFTSLKGSKHARGLHMNSFEITGGVQKSFCYDLTFGLAGSYQYDHVKYSRGGKGNRNAEYIAVYGLYRPCLFYGLVDFAYGHTSNNLSRAIQAGALRYKAHSKPNISQFTFYGEIGFDWNAGCFLIQPFLGIQSGRNWRKHITENYANGWGLVINEHHWSTTSSRLGVHATASGFCNCIDISMDLAWNQLLSSHKNSNHAHFRGFGEAFLVCGNNIDQSSVDYAITFTTCPCHCMKAYLEFGGETWKHANTFDVLGGIEFTW